MIAQGTARVHCYRCGGWRRSTDVPRYARKCCSRVRSLRSAWSLERGSASHPRPNAGQGDTMEAVERKQRGKVMRRKVLKLYAALLVVFGIASYAAQAQDIPTIRFGRQTAAEDNLWLMLAKPSARAEPEQGLQGRVDAVARLRGRLQGVRGRADRPRLHGRQRRDRRGSLGPGVEDHRHPQPGNREGCEHQVSGEEGRPEQDRRPERRDHRDHRLSQLDRAVGARRAQDRRNSIPIAT